MSFVISREPNTTTIHAPPAIKISPTTPRRWSSDPSIAKALSISPAVTRTPPHWMMPRGRPDDHRGGFRRQAIFFLGSFIGDYFKLVRHIAARRLLLPPPLGTSLLGSLPKLTAAGPCLCMSRSPTPFRYAPPVGTSSRSSAARWRGLGRPLLAFIAYCLS
jgi:hypothetical protein